MGVTLSMFDRAPSPMIRDQKQARPYQVKAIAAIAAKLAEHRSTLLVMPTGTGKTFTFSQVAKAERGAVLVLAHREELIEQARRDLATNTGALIGVEKAEREADGARIVVASVQTLKGDRLARFAKAHAPALIIVDEAHHAVAPSYRAVLDAFPEAKVLGVTATPDRTDERAMGQVFDSVAFVYEIQEAIADGFLCPIRVQRVHVDAIDLRAVRTVAGDLNQDQLDAVMSAEEVLHGVVKPTLELAGNRRTIVFTTSVENAHRMAEIFNRYRPDAARAVDGGTNSDERARILRDHKAGVYQFLCNVGVLTEGYDDPAVSCVAMARPTKSRSLYAQCAGRGLRVLPGKADCLLLDFAGNSGSHSLASALDILAGKYDEDVVARAREIVERDGGALAEDALAQAAKEIEEAKAREAAKRARVKGAVAYRTQTVTNPFEVLHVKNPDDDPWAERYATPASEKQRETLTKFGMEVAELTKSQASKLIGTAIKRRELNLASFKQLKTLRRYGITETNISFARASKVIDAIAKNNWRALPPEQVYALLSRDAGDELY
jgi:superfamily II DNA or RNA helicase